MITATIILTVSLWLAIALTIRAIGNDENYGEVGFGQMTQSAANTWSTALLAAVIEPTAMIKTSRSKGFGRILESDIEDILVWDLRRWLVRLGITPTVAGGESDIQAAEAGITKDNTREATDAPTSGTAAQGSLPGGNGAAVTGTAGVDASAPTVGQDVSNFLAGWDFGIFANEENAAGEINMNAFSVKPKSNHDYQPYKVDGHWIHQLLTAAHYHCWIATEGLAAASTLSLGGSARKMSVGLDELIYDRATFFSIVDALVLSR